MAEERSRNEREQEPTPGISGDAGKAPHGSVSLGRGGDSIVQDRATSGTPDLPIDRDPGRETNVAINADDLNAETPGPSERKND